MSDKYEWYIAGPGTRARLDQWQQETRDTITAWNALAEEMGAKSAVHQGGRIVGFLFETPPEGWKPSKTSDGKRFYAPYRRGKANMGIWTKMEAHPHKATEKLNKEFLDDPWGAWCEATKTGAVALRGVYPRQIEDDWLLGIPIATDQKKAPDDCTRIPLSEYYRRIESAEAEKAA